MLAVFTLSLEMAIAKNNTYSLDEIVVTATRYPVHKNETPVSVEVINQEKINNSTAENVAEVINNIAGVNIINYGGSTGQKIIHIRGSKPSQVLILMDGQPINNNQNGQTDLGQLPLSNVKKIEVLKGPASALYGANALGGVVNIMTETADEDPSRDLNVSFGSYNSSDLEFSYSTTKEKNSYLFTIDKKSSAGFRKNPDHSGMTQLALFSKINHQLNDNSELVFTLNYQDSNKEVPGSLSYQTPNAIQNDLTKNINIKWKQNKSHLETTAMFYYNKHKQKYDNPDQFSYEGPSLHKTKNIGFDIKRTNYLNKHTISYGMEIKNNSIDSNENGEHEFLNSSLFLQDEWQLKDSLKLILGSRYDNHEKFGSRVNTRLGTMYNINKNINCYFSAGQAYRTPTFNDLYWPADAFSEGNPDLSPENGMAYEIGLIKKNNNMKTEINVFKKEITDMISWAQGSDDIYRPYNINKAAINGLELIFEKQLNQYFSLSFNYSYLDAVNQKTNEQLAGSAKHRSNLNLKYTPADYKISVNSSYVGTRADDSLNNYIVVDTRLAKTLIVKNKEIEVSLSINNLFNKNYQVNTGYPMPNRNYTLEIGTNF